MKTFEISKLDNYKTDIYKTDMYQLNTFNITKMRVSINGRVCVVEGGATKIPPKNVMKLRGT